MMLGVAGSDDFMENYLVSCQKWEILLPSLIPHSRVSMFPQTEIGIQFSHVLRLRLLECHRSLLLPFFYKWGN